MNTAILIFGVLFFAALSLYNLIHSFKHKKSYLPSVIGLLMCLMTVFVLYDKLIVGAFLSVIILLLVIFSSSTIFGIRKRSFLKAIDGVDITSTFSAMHILDVRFWAVYALKNGVKKAAVGYSLSQAVFLIVILAIVTFVFPSHMTFYFWTPFIFVAFGMGWREYNIIFREFCESKK